MRSRVYSGQVHLLYSNQALAVIATAMVVALFFWYLSAIIPWQDLSVWFSMFTGILVLRTLTTWLYFHNGKLRTGDAVYAGLIYLTGTILTGSLWASMVLLLFADASLEAQILFFIVCVGMAGVSSTTMGYAKTPIKIFNMLLVVPLMISIYHSDFPNAEAVLAGLLLYVAFLLRSTHLFSNTVADMLYLQERAVEREQLLVRRREESDKANQAKSDFLSRMSHELRTPLNAVLGMNELQMLDKDSPISDKQMDRARKINDAGEHLLTLVNDVLDLSRIEAGSLDVIRQSFDCQELIRDVMEMIESDARNRELMVSFEAKQQPVWVAADRNRTRQVLINLLDNAVKFNKRGGVISISITGTNNKSWRISIIDTGCGIDADALDDIFVPFARPHREQSAIDSKGIGLSLSRQLVLAMDGHMGVNSRQGEGSRFWLELPKAEPQPVTEQLQKFGHHVQASSQALPGSKVAAFEGKLVLLVEDNPINQEVSVEMLNDMDLMVDVACNGAEAIEMLAKNDYALILMDCEMPIMDGFDATEKIRESEFRQKLQPTPIVALTAHAVQGAREKCLASGMDDYLSKPFNFEDLQFILSKWLSIDSDTDVDTTEQQYRSDDAPGTPTAVEQVSDRTEYTSVHSLDSHALDLLRATKTHPKKNLVVKVVDMFLEQSPPMLEKMQRAATDNNLEELDILAHTFKTSSMTVGAVTLANTCKEIELQCGEGELDLELIEQLRKDYEVASAQLLDILDVETAS